MAEEADELLAGIDLPEIDKTASPAVILLQKLLSIQKVVNGLKKDKQSHSYAYTTGDKILSYIKPLMNYYGVILEPHVTGVVNTKYDYKTGSGNYVKDKTEIHSAVTMNMVWVCADTAAERHISWFANGMNDWEKGYGSALTYGERYFFLKYFHIATDEDDIDNPDRKEQEQQGQNAGAGKAEDKPKSASTAPPVAAKKAAAPKAQTNTATPPPAEKREEKAPVPPKENPPKPEEVVVPPADKAVAPPQSDDASRKERAKKIFATMDQGAVLKFLIEKKGSKLPTINDWIDSNATDTVLQTYNEYMQQAPAK